MRYQESLLFCNALSTAAYPAIFVLLRAANLLQIFLAKLVTLSLAKDFLTFLNGSTITGLPILARI